MLVLINLTLYNLNVLKRINLDSKCKKILHIYKWYQDQTNKKDYITTMTKKG